MTFSIPVSGWSGGSLTPAKSKWVKFLRCGISSLKVRRLALIFLFREAGEGGELVVPDPAFFVVSPFRILLPQPIVFARQNPPGFGIGGQESSDKEDLGCKCWCLSDILLK